MKKYLFVLSVLIALSLYVLPASAEPSDSLSVEKNGYTLRQLADNHFSIPQTPPMPDLSPYTHEAVLQKVPPLDAGSVRVQPLNGPNSSRKFAESKRLPEFVKLQNTDAPQIIVVESGVHDLEAVYKAINTPALLEKSGEGYLLKVPLLVEHGATLIIAGDENQKLSLKLSASTGALLVNAGQLYVVHADLSGWDESSNNYARFEDEKIFRPFLASWTGSQTFISRSHFSHMGYYNSKSYGVTFSSDTYVARAKPDLPRPTGWIIESVFEELYYGFYTYEADDVVLIRNEYKNSIKYGIDPHDRSNRLIIAYNNAHGTKERHGIIGSREVNDCWIIYNKSWGNKRSGIVLDRESVRNVVAFNETYDNGTDGITLFESRDNYIHNNTIYGNARDGIRVRNSWDVYTWNNILRDNGIGIEIYASDIYPETRDPDHDPYKHKAMVSVINDSFINNSEGMLNVRDIDLLRLQDIKSEGLNDKPLRGDMGGFNDYTDILIGGGSFEFQSTKEDASN